VSVGKYINGKDLSDDTMELRKTSDLIWEIQKYGAMKVPAFVYASERLMEKIKQDKTLQQAANVATLKGIVKASYTMPDAHEGFLIGTAI
jgi:tRNA-splicing ligase RtcB